MSWPDTATWHTGWPTKELRSPLTMAGINEDFSKIWSNFCLLNEERFDWNSKIICSPSFLSLTYWIIFQLQVEHFKISQFSFCLLHWYYLVRSIPGFEIPYFLPSKDQIITAWYLIQCRKKQNWRKRRIKNLEHMNI